MKFKPGHYPGVYIAYKNGDVMYVGFSPANVYNRVVSHDHSILTRHECDLVRVFTLDSAEDASLLERILINKLKPPLNRLNYLPPLTHRETMRNAMSAKSWLGKG